MSFEGIPKPEMYPEPLVHYSESIEDAVEFMEASKNNGHEQFRLLPGGLFGEHSAIVSTREELEEWFDTVKGVNGKDVRIEVITNEE